MYNQHLPTLCVLLLCGFLQACTAIHSTQLRSFTKPHPQSDTLYKIEVDSYSQPYQVSSNARYVAYALRGARADLSVADAALWVRRIEDNHTQRLPGSISSGRAVNMRPSWSPDSTKLAYFADDIENSGTLQLFIWDMSTGVVRTIQSEPPHPSYAGATIHWSPDSRFIYFHSYSTPESVELKKPGCHVDDIVMHSPEEKVDSDQQLDSANILVVNVVSGDVKTLIQLDTGPDKRVEPFSISPDGLRLIFMELYQESLDIRQVYARIFSVTLPKNWNQISSRRVARAPGEHLDWRGSVVPPVVDKLLWSPLGRVAWSPNSQLIAFGEFGPLANGDIFILDFASGLLENLTSSIEAQSPETPLANLTAYSHENNKFWPVPVWSADSTTVYAQYNSPALGHPVWRFTIEDGAVTTLGTSDGLNAPKLRAYTRAGQPRTGFLLSGQSVVTEGSTPGSIVMLAGPSHARVDRLIEVGLEPKTAHTLVEFGGNRTSVHSIGAYVFSIDQESYSTAELVVRSVNDKAERLVTNLHRQPSIETSWNEHGKGIRLHQLNWKDERGQIHAAELYMPKIDSYDDGQKPPVILSIYPSGIQHSSPDEIEEHNTEHIRAFVSTWNPRNRIQSLGPSRRALLESGYAVIIPNMTVKGHGGTCSDVAKQAKAVLSAALRDGQVDTSRAGLMGYSFGGWAVNCIISHTDLFGAAVSIAGVSNMLSMRFNEPHGSWTRGGGQAKIGSSIFDMPQLYFDESPVYRVRNIKTPLLLMHGRDDEAVPYAQSVEMFNALREFQKSATLVVYGGLGHLLDRHPDSTHRILDWFEQKVGSHSEIVQ